MFAKVKSVCVCVCLSVCVLAPLGTRWLLVPLSFPLLPPEGPHSGSRLPVPRDQAPQLGEQERQKPPRVLEASGNSWGLCGSLAAKVREGYDTSCTFRICTHTHRHKRAQPTEQPVFRAPLDDCFDSQGEKIVIERTSDTCVVMSWGGNAGHAHTHTRAHVSEQGRCHHNGLMSKELQGEYSGAGYTHRSVRVRQGEREIGRKRMGRED